MCGPVDGGAVDRTLRGFKVFAPGLDSQSWHESRLGKLEWLGRGVDQPQNISLAAHRMLESSND
jgi:hypothetical protein